MYDSKYVWFKLKKKFYSPSPLSTLYKKLKTDKSIKSNISISIDGDPIYKRYVSEANVVENSLSISFAHEAGFDAYMAGSVFLYAWKTKEISDVMDMKQKQKELSQSANLFQANNRK